MRSGKRRKRTDSQSDAFKAEIIRLRGQKMKMSEIAKRLQVTKQYVSLVLKEAGEGGRDGSRADVAPEKGSIEHDISRLEQRQEHTLVTWLRVLKQRRKE